MDKKKKSKKNSNSNNNDNDHSSIVKAAAWAWYQHGSGSNYEESGKLRMREFDVTRTRQAPKPSRYKLEAMKMIKENAIKESQMQSPMINKENSLLDDYEIECISKRFDDFIESNSSKRLFFDRQVSNKSSFSDGYISSSNSSNNSVSKRKNKNFLKRLWPRHAIVCGAKNDVDTRAFDRRPSPVAGRYVPVITMAVSRPRAAHAL